MLRRLLIVGLCSLVGAGCARKGPPPKTYPVGGKVVLPGGQPLSGGWVTLHPKDPPGNEAVGMVAKDGTFVLGTFGKDDGALPGRYTITVGPLPGASAALNAGPRSQIPTRYWEPGTSPLTFEVKAGEKNTITEIRLQ
jgi:hypothetical protein